MVKLISLLLIAFTATCAHADTLIKIQQYTPAIDIPGMTTAATTDTTLIWIGDQKGRMDVHPDISTIYDAKTGAATNINRKFKIFYPSSLNMSDLMSSQADSGISFEEGLSELSPKILTKVHSTDQVNAVNGIDCRKWVQIDSITMIGAKIVSDLWVAKQTNFDVNLYWNLIYASQDSHTRSAMLKELSKVEGMPILTNVGVVGDSSSLLGAWGGSQSRVISIETVKVPADYYDIPKDFESYPPTPEEE